MYRKNNGISWLSIEFLQTELFEMKCVIAALSVRNVDLREIMIFKQQIFD